MMHRKLLITLALAGTTAYLVAQAVGPRTKTGGSPQGPTEGAAVAQRLPGGTPTNAAQRYLQQQIANWTNYYIEKAREENREGVVSYLIEAQCYHILTAMSDSQRKNEIDKVWAVEKWQPGGKWNHVTSAPRKARTLLDLTSDQDRRISSILDGLWKERLEVFQNKTRELHDKQGLREQALADAYSRWLEAYWGNKTMSLRSKSAVDHFAKGMAASRDVLTAAQQAEWDAIVAGFTVDLKQAFEGSNSPPDSH